MKHDYEAAINQRYLSDDEAWVRDYGDIIEHALKLAAKVTGEPSDGMVNAAVESWNDQKFSVEMEIKAVIAQAEREIEG